MHRVDEALRFPLELAIELPGAVYEQHLSRRAHGACSPACEGIWFSLRILGHKGLLATAGSQ